jgi:hypothetical protein
MNPHAIRPYLEEDRTRNDLKSILTVWTNRLRLSEICQRYVDELWLPDLCSAEQAAASAHDQFKRAVLAEIELLALQWIKPPNPTPHGF